MNWINRALLVISSVAIGFFLAWSLIPDSNLNIPSTSVMESSKDLKTPIPESRSAIIADINRSYIQQNKERIDSVQSQFNSFITFSSLLIIVLLGANLTILRQSFIQERKALLDSFDLKRKEFQSQFRDEYEKKLDSVDRKLEKTYSELKRQVESFRSLVDEKVSNAEKKIREASSQAGKRIAELELARGVEQMKEYKNTLGGDLSKTDFFLLLASMSLKPRLEIEGRSKSDLAIINLLDEITKAAQPDNTNPIVGLSEVKKIVRRVRDQADNAFLGMNAQESREKLNGIEEFLEQLKEWTPGND